MKLPTSYQVKNFPKLYKRTELGQIQVWWMEFDGKESYRTHSGKKDGAIVTSGWTKVAGKNLGKANETSGKAQAFKEIEAHYTKRLESKYTKEETEIDSVGFFSPMLAYVYEEGSPLAFPVLSQPKLNGMRCSLSLAGAKSRKNKPIYTVPFLFEAFKDFFKQHPSFILDGELYSHEHKENFPKIMSLLRKQKPTKADILEASESIKLHLYDYYDGSLTPAHLRQKALRELICGTFKKCPWVIYVQTDICNNQKELDARREEYVSDGYEGQMIRDMHAPYQQKRTQALLKRKLFNDEEFKILAVLEGKGNKAGKVGSFTIQLKNGKTCEAGLRGDHTYLAKLWENRKSLVGKKATVRFQEYSPYGVPIFPVVIDIDRQD